MSCGSPESSPKFQNEDNACIMNPRQCIQRPPSVRSLLSSQSDRCVDKSSVDLVHDAERPPQKMVGSEGPFLRKVSKLISSEKWRALDLVLWSASNNTTSCGSSPDDISDAAEDDAVPSLHIVHFACRFNPPRSIIKRLASTYPAGINTPDKTGRLPLHHAAKWGASHRLIKCLIEMDPSAVRAKDSEGKTPIHHLCLHYVDAFRPNKELGDVSVEQCMLQSINVLLEADPSILTMEDNLEATALEYAIESNAPYRVVRRLQKASERYLKDRQKSSMSDQSSRSLNDSSREVDNNSERHCREPEDGQRQIAELLATFKRMDASSSSQGEEKSDDQINNSTKLPTTTLGKKPSSARSKYAMTA
eukprot:CCRYP_019411-RA/>CCRYP_019411-RA protein AED:0.14 eAED:0.14 QI:0/0/0/1/1/1/3/0/361